VFSNLGKLYWLKTYLLPQGSRGARGKPIVNLLPLVEGERITAILPISEYTQDRYTFMATAHGVVKKVSLNAFAKPRANGIVALGLDKGDCLIGAGITGGSQNIMLFTDAGKAIHFYEKASPRHG